MAKIVFKDVLNLPLAEARKSVKDLTEKQLTNMFIKLTKLKTIIDSESNNRYTESLVEEIEAQEDAQDEIDAQTIEELEAEDELADQAIAELEAEETEFVDTDEF